MKLGSASPSCLLFFYSCLVDDHNSAAISGGYMVFRKPSLMPQSSFHFELTEDIDPSPSSGITSQSRLSEDLEGVKA